MESARSVKHEKPECPRHMAICCLLGYFLQIAIGYLRDFMCFVGLDKGNHIAVEYNRDGYPPLYRGFENFYVRHFFRRLCHGWSIPIKSVPGAYIDVMDRYSDDHNLTFKYPGTTTRAINMGSYNYLGYAENSGPIVDQVERDLKMYGSSTLSTRAEFGVTETLIELETKMAQFLGAEACLVSGMGFATNSNNIPAIAGGEGTLVLSDEYNHSSLALGCKISGACVRVFKHNDPNDLEMKIRRALLEGNVGRNRDKRHKRGARTSAERKPWKRIIIMVEGIFSMEGSIVNLPAIIRIKKRYKAYLYLDEAHSIGALGKGVVSYFNCNPKDVDILMGTFTKSFGAAGGYIAGSQALIDFLLEKSHGSCYTTTMAAPIARQIIGVVDSLMCPDINGDGARRLRTLADNTRYFRSELKRRGFIVYGSDDSPVVPLVVFAATVVVDIIMEALRHKVAIVGAGYPATPIFEARVRFCLSASHTREMLDEVIDVIDDIGDRFHIKFAQDQYRLKG
ncbi:Serine palmitoyltransferase 2, partial [Fragariocoptes setiger]